MTLPGAVLVRPILTHLTAFALTGLILAACVQTPVAAPPPPDLPGKTLHYTCGDGGHLAVTYGAGQVTLAGPETLLADETNPNRYSWPSDGTHHVWTLDGAMGTLALQDGTKGTQTVVHAACKADGIAR